MALTLNINSRGTGGTPVLFVHSFAGDLSHWSATQEHLESSRRSVALDLSGHGASPGAVGRYSIQELAKDIAAVANSQGLEHFALIGHSTGALIAAEYAGSDPQRVKSLGLIDPPAAPGAIPQEQIQRLRAALESDPYGTIERYWRQGPFVGSRPETQMKLLTSLHRLPRKATIELTGSGLEYDAPLSLHNAVPGLQHTVMKGTGHWIQLDQPREFNQVLDLFLAQ